MNKIKYMMGLTILFSSASSFAACPPISGIVGKTPTASPGLNSSAAPVTHDPSGIWRSCWASVEADTFSGQALLDLNNLKLQYQQKYHAALLASLLESSEQKIAFYQGAQMSLTQAVNENYAAQMEGETQMKTQMLEMEMDYMRELQETKMNEENQGFFNDENGEDGLIRTDTQSYAYMKSVCKRNKMFNKTASAVYKEKRSLEVNKAVTQKSKEMTEVTGNANALANSIMFTQNNDYCTPESIKYELCTNPELKLCEDDNVESGVCKVAQNEIFEMTNKNTDALNLLTPNGFDGRYAFNGSEIEPARNKIEDELFTVTQTYNEEEEKAAKDFANLLIFQAGVKAPSLDEKKQLSSKEFVAHYNRYLANLNLSNYSFQNAIKARQPITEGEIKMSEKDIMRYIIHNLKDPDVNSATMAAKGKGKELMLYQLMTVNNKLKLESLDQKERIETLLAAMVAQSANTPEFIQRLEELK